MNDYYFFTVFRQINIILSAIRLYLFIIFELIIYAKYTVIIKKKSLY